MKKNKLVQIRSFLVALMVLFFFCTNAQSYIEMMNDNGYNVYEVIKAGNSYFKGKDKGKGTGWKQFQRWIIANEDLFYPSGDRSNYQPELPYFLARSKQNQTKLKASNRSKLLASNWTEVGPFVELKRYYDNVRNGNGRVDAIWVDPSDANRIYIGCRGGGMWTTTDGGTSWSVKTDNLGITGVNSIAVNSSNVNDIYIATALAGKRSLGVFKSTDAGSTWTITGVSYLLTTNITINKILMSPTTSSVLFAATSSGLLKSTDGFQTYTAVLNGNILDVEFKPGDASIMFASNNSNDTIYKSTDSGSSFTSTGLVATGKPKIAVSANQPNYVYVSANNALYLSIDNGLNFTQQGQPETHYGGFAVSDIDADLVFNGTIDVLRSTDGGSNFSKVTDYRYNQSTGIGGNFVHADIREIEIVNGIIYIGSDGWLSKSIDGGISYEILTFNIGNQEVYEHGMGVAQSNDNTLVIGTQDNGTSVLRNGVWHHWKGGDGGTSMIDDTNENIIYGSLYNGNFKRTDNGAITGTTVDLGDTKPGTLPPLVKHPTDPATIFMGEDNGEVWKSTNRGLSWTTIANLGGTFVVDELGVAPSNGDYIYVSIKNKIWRTTNEGSTWSELTGTLPNLVIKGIAIDYDNPDKVVICYTSYTSGIKVYQTSNGGTNWINISGTLPNLPMTDVVYDNNINNTLYVSTQMGVYFRDDMMSDWSEFGTGLPNVRANDLEIQHSSSTLYVGTWGRGVWKAPLITDVEENVAPTITAATYSLAENSANGTVLGTVEATDPDGDTLTYLIISGNDAEAFSLDSVSGALTVSMSSALDFETTPSYSLGIEVSDGALSDSATVTINLTDVDETTLSLADASEMIYPNPTDGIINIKMAAFKEATVYNLSGKRIMRSSDNRIDVSALSEGVYIIKLENWSGDRFSTRLIKE